MIAFVCHPYHRGGVTRWMVDIAIAYAQTDIQVFFVTVTPSRPFISSGGKETIVSLLSEAPGVKLVTKNVGWNFEFGTEQYRAGIYAALLSGNVPKGIPVILSDDSSIWKMSSLLPQSYNFIGVLHADEKVYYDFAIKYQKSINIFVAVSNRVKNTLLANPAFNLQDVYVIPCGIELPALADKKLRNATANIAYIGRVSEYQKRVSDLIRISTILAAENFPFSMKIIGDGEARIDLENKVQEGKLAANISFLGWCSKKKIFEILSASDIVLLVSDFEGMPVAAMEGLAAGCAIVSTKVSGVEDLEQHALANNCIWLNDVGDVNTAVNNIKNAMAMPIELGSIAARTIAEDEFSINTCMNRYDAAILQNPLENLLHHSFKKERVGILYSNILSLSRYIRVKKTKNN